VLFRSTTFDGMMTGEVDGASAAMSGDMSFSGDMSAAMGLQALQEDMMRLWLLSK
jgi:putative sterol carrier protein